MPKDGLKRNKAAPMHQQLKEKLAAMIESGEYVQGARIPSENELSSKYKISRVTVRKALATLVEEGLLVKRQGMGAFVEKPKLKQKVIQFESFSTACAYNGMRPGSKLVKRLVREPTESERRELQLESNDHVLQIQRLRYADDELLLLEDNYFSYGRFPYLLDAELEHNSLYELLRNHGVKLSHSKKIIEVLLANEESSQMLHIKLGSPLFHLKGIVYDDNSFPVHIAIQFIRADRYKFLI